MNRLQKTIATGAAAAGLLAATLAGTAQIALADGTGQIEGGAAVYEAKNLTTGSAYGDNTTASACDELQYSIRLHNSGFVAVDNINVKVNLPSGASTTNTSTMTATYTNGLVPSTSDTTTVTFANPQTITYENGTTQLFNGNGQLVGTQADGIVAGGLSLGSLNGSTTEYVNFKAKVNCPQPQTPAFSCDAFSIAADVNRTVKVTNFKTSATNGAVFTKADVNWGDNSALTTAANIIGQSHQYSADGTYTIVATAHFTVNGQDQTASGPQCQQKVTFASNKPPVVTPPTTPTPPAQLVNTGAGSVIGLFAAATALGTAAYRFVLRRQLV